MGFLRYLLFPFSVLYMIVMSLRNFLFSAGVFKSKTYAVPSLGIGNLSTGGTGKSVAINYFISLFKEDYPITVLSRGYGRISKGFQLGDEDSTAKTVGDEPLMFLQQHPGIRVGVCNNRRQGMNALIGHESNKGNGVFLWDDCFQHRWVKPSYMVLLTTFSSPYFKDYVLPVGNLRELSEGADRADIIIVTKCPQNLSLEQQTKIRERLQPKNHQHLFFSSIRYADTVYGKSRQLPLSVLSKIPFLLVTSIADASELVFYLKGKFEAFEHMPFKDHHLFTDADIDQILAQSNGRMILTTQKDFTRLSPLLEEDILFYLPIEMEILNGASASLNSLVKEGMSLI